MSGGDKGSGVMPAESGIHNHSAVFVDSGFRGSEEIAEVLESNRASFETAAPRPPQDED